MHSSRDGSVVEPVVRRRSDDDLTDVEMGSGHEEDHPNDVDSVREVSSDVGSAVEDPISEPDPDPEIGDVRLSADTRAALRSLDDLNLVEELNRRPSVMKSPPAFLRGAFRSALKLAIQEAVQGGDIGDLVIQERGWKLLMMLPRMLLFKPPRGGSIGKEKLAERFAKCNNGHWIDLISSSRQCDQEFASVCRRARRRNQEGDLERRTETAHRLVQLGELSSARQALEGSDLAPGNRTTLEALQTRPAQPRDPLPDDIIGHMPSKAFELEEVRFGQNLRLSRKGAAAGPSGLTTEHLRPLLDSSGAMHLFFRLGDQLAQAAVPGPIVDALRLGRMTALQKPNGGVRGIVAGDTIRRLVSRTMAQQLGRAVEKATAPHQYALSTRAGCECVSRALWMLHEANPDTTLVSISRRQRVRFHITRAHVEGPLGSHGR